MTKHDLWILFCMEAEDRGLAVDWIGARSKFETPHSEWPLNCMWSTCGGISEWNRFQDEWKAML